MKRLSKLLTSTLIAVVAFVAVAGVVSVLSPDLAQAANVDKVQGGIDKIGGDEAGNTGADFSKLLKSIINILLFLIGAIAVIMIIVGGIRYVTSAGDQSAVTGAKNTILYAIVGLVIAVMSYAIVNFFLDALK